MPRSILAALLLATLALPAAAAAPPEGPELILGRWNKNRWISEVFAFYGDVDRREPREVIRARMGEDVYFRIRVPGKTLSEARGFDGFAEKLEGIYQKYPVVDRTLDGFEVVPAEPGRVDVRFRLTSLVLRPDGDVEVALRAGMRFGYRLGDDGRPQIVEYEARPQLSTIPKTLWERVKNLF